jgi:hypothetical protein
MAYVSPGLREPSGQVFVGLRGAPSTLARSTDSTPTARPLAVRAADAERGMQGHADVCYPGGRLPALKIISKLH